MKKQTYKTLKKFMQTHYKHFNASVIVDAAEAYTKLLKKGGKMFLAMAGALSTAEIGISLAEMIRKDKVHGISCTAANLEEDIFNLVAHKHYKRVPQYRDLTPDDEVKLLQQHLNRVTDTCIPEEEAMRKIEQKIITLWGQADKKKKRYFPYEYIYQLIRNRELEKEYEIDPNHSWVIAACQKNIPIYTPGWEDSTLGNFFAAYYLKNSISDLNIVKSGIEQMHHLINWYKTNSKEHSIGFFQIGGGIAGDFAICVVPLIQQDLNQKCKMWSYFCQISDSITS